MAGRFEIKRSKDQFMWNLKAGNGKVILTSERYKSKKSAETGISSVKKNCRIDKCYARKASKNGKPRFNLIASNGETIGTSQLYSSISAMEKGIASVKASAAKASIRDAT